MRQGVLHRMNAVLERPGGLGLRKSFRQVLLKMLFYV